MSERNLGRHIYWLGNLVLVCMVIGLAGTCTARQETAHQLDAICAAIPECEAP